MIKKKKKTENNKKTAIKQHQKPSQIQNRKVASCSSINTQVWNQ
jgi:hypothetical protein